MWNIGLYNVETPFRHLLLILDLFGEQLERCSRIYQHRQYRSTEMISLKSTDSIHLAPTSTDWVKRLCWVDSLMSYCVVLASYVATSTCTDCVAPAWDLPSVYLLIRTCYCIVTGSITRSAKRRYMYIQVTPRQILRFFAAQRRLIAPIMVKFVTEEWTKGALLREKFHPHRCNDKGIEPQN